MRIQIPTWILCGSHTKFEFSLSPVFESKPNSNSDSIFLWVPVYYRYGPTFFFSPHFFLSPSEASLLLSLALGHYRARTPLPSSPIIEPHIFSLFITLSQTPTTSTTATTTPNPIFFPQISSTTHKKSQRSSKNKSGSDPLDSRLKIRFFEKYIKFQWSSKSVPKLVWWRERLVPGIREGGNTEREAHGFRRSQEWATVHRRESERNCWVRELRDRMGFRAAWNGLDWRLSES